MPLGSAAAAATIAAAISINPLMAVNAADSGNGTSGKNVQCSITSNNNSTDAATKTGDVFGTAQVQPTAEQLQRAGEILDQARTLLGELPLTGGDGTATALRARLQARGITPALGTGVAQAARDASDALLTVPGTRPASIATALARAGYGPTPADVVPRVVTAVAAPGQPISPTVSAVYTPAVAPGAGPVSALANLVDQQPAIQRQMLTAADSDGSQAYCLAWLSKVQKLVEQALADPSDPATARVLQELQNSDGADLLLQGNGQQSEGTAGTPSSGSGDATSSPRGEGAGVNGGSGGLGTGGVGGSGLTGSGSTSQGTSDNAGSGSTGERSTDGAEGDWQSATQDLLSKLDAAAPDDPTAGEWASDIRGVIGQEGQSASEASGSGQGSSSESSSSGDSSSGDASSGNGQSSDDNHDQGEQDSSRGSQDSSDKPEQPAAAPPPAAAAPTASNSWESLANCESSGKWDTNTGNGYYGGLQFDNATWSAYGGTKYAPSADKATKEQQIEIAEKVRQDRGGFGAWPACSSKLGLSK